MLLSYKDMAYVTLAIFYSQRTHNFKQIKEYSTTTRLTAPINRQVSSSKIDIFSFDSIYRIYINFLSVLI